MHTNTRGDQRTSPVAPSTIDRRPSERFDGTLIVGAGPAGLAAGAALGMLGLRAKLLDRADRVASTWLSYYDGLRLNSPRSSSSLPGLKIEPGCGRWPVRNDMIVYFERYARHHALDIDFGVEVQRISREGGEWCVSTSTGDLRAPHVVVATGLNGRPVMPAWPGADEFTGELLHARDYRNSKPYKGKDALVVGSGTTGADIAIELLAAGARSVRMSVRSPPLIFRRQRLGVPATSIAHRFKRVPPVLHPLLDRISLKFTAGFGDLSEFGLEAPTEGVMTAVRSRSGSGGGLIDQGFVAAVKRSEITIVKAVEAFDGADVILADGERIQPDVVIAATGQRPMLQPLVGHLGVLGRGGHPIAHGSDVIRSAPGMYFIGYRLLSGQLPDMPRDALRIARHIRAATAKRA